MIEDELLKFAFKRGSKDALRRIYEKYRDYLLTSAMALLNDEDAAEDVLHDVFVKFSQSAGRFALSGSLKHYLAICVANRARDRLRAGILQPGSLNTEEPIESELHGPETRIIATEQSCIVSAAMAQLPFEQREVVALHLSAGMTFRQIAKHCNISASTAKGRYRYGLQKRRSSLNGRL